MGIKSKVKKILYRIDPTYRMASNNRMQIDNLRNELFGEIIYLKELYLPLQKHECPKYDRMFLVTKMLLKKLSEIISGVEFVGQELQDMYAYLYFNGKRNGFYIDIGAYDGVAISNTLVFEKLGWKGICVEPIPELYQYLIKNRTCDCVNAAIYDEDKQLEFLQTKGGRSGAIVNMSKDMMDAAEAEGIVKKLPIKTITFDSLMENYDIEYIDFLSIDVEGAELNVLTSINFNKYKFGLITIENNHGTQKLKEFMTERGYKIFLDLGVDLFFIPEKVNIGRYWWNDL